MSIIGMCGMRISVGDFVCYPGRAGSDVWIRYGFVTKIQNGHNIKVGIARSTRHPTYDSNTDQWILTDYVRHNLTIWRVDNLVKVDFDDTKFSKPDHPEYKIFQEIKHTLEKPINMDIFLDIGDYSGS